MDALACGDRHSYEAANQLANDAFGKTFYTRTALRRAFIWPICVALAWMQYRFLDLAFPIPFIGLSLGYIGIFILLFIPAYFLFKRLKRKLSYFKRLKPRGEICRIRHTEAGGQAEAQPLLGAPPDDTAGHAANYLNLFMSNQ